MTDAMPSRPRTRRRRPIEVAHVITGLGVGGAETVLLRLARRLPPSEFGTKVISLTGKGVIGLELEASGVTVRAMNVSRTIPNPLFLFRLSAVLWKWRPDIVQTWLYHGDFVGGLAAKLAGRRRVVWNIRHSHPDPRHDRRSTIWCARACAALSGRLPSAIVCNSDAAASIHVGLGYDGGRMRIIPNGVDVEAFRPDASARSDIREELGVPGDAFLIGLVGRFHPHKNHRAFVDAAGRLASLDGRARFVLCGENVMRDNSVLASWIEATGYGNRFHLLGVRRDVSRITAALDVSTSSSHGESFSNVIVEAMACGVPCVVTDVGDSRLIVGGTGIVVPPGSPAALVDAWRSLLGMPASRRSSVGAAARRRVTEEYSIETMVARFGELYAQIARADPSPDRNLWISEG